MEHIQSRWYEVIRKRRHMCVLGCFCLFICFFGSSLGHAAPYTENYTILYYLVEMQRQYGQPCDGAAKSSMGALMPSPKLQAVASELVAANKNIDQERARLGLQNATVFFMITPAGTPQQTLDYLKKMHCPALMDPSYRYIGAVELQDMWGVIMASDEPAEGVAGLNTPPPVVVAIPQEPETPVRQPRSDVVPLQDERPPAAETGSSVAQMMSDPLSQSMQSTSIQEEGTVSANPSAAEMELGAARGAGTDIEPSGTFAADTAEEAVVASSVAVKQSVGVREAGGKLSSMVNHLRTQGYACEGSIMLKAPPLKSSVLLDAIASRHAKDMALRGYFSSTTPEGEKLGKRLTDSSYNWLQAAEAMAKGTNPENALHSLLQKKSSCQLLLDPSYTEIGVGYTPEGPFWVIILASPASDDAIRLE